MKNNATPLAITEYTGEYTNQLYGKIMITNNGNQLNVSFKSHNNLTATIVLVSLLQKIIKNRKMRLWFAGLIVIAANAGGAFSPIGDVTTTMLWIAKNVTALGLIKYVVIPSVICFVIPFSIASYLPAFRGEIQVELDQDTDSGRLLSSKKMLFLGLAMIVSVPIFKTLTHLPPYIGMMLALGVVWLVSEYIHPEEDFSKNWKSHIDASGGTTDEKELKKHNTKKEAKEKQISTHQVTIQYIEQGMSLKEISEERGMTYSTIQGHILTISDKYPDVDISAYRPESVLMDRINEVYKKAESKAKEDDYSGDGRLKSSIIFRALGDKIDYATIKLAYAFLDI